jgi:hypothetical protein
VAMTSAARSVRRYNCAPVRSVLASSSITSE